jgi:hypothetical protein
VAYDPNLLRRCSEDRALASSILFPHRHPQMSGELHVAMMTLWGSRNEFVLFEAFREAGKTTTAEEFIALEGCFANFHYGLIIGETYSKACQRLEAIDKECRSNMKLQRLFGGPVLARKSIENRLWFKAGPMLEAWGWEQELQSFKYHEHRPDLAYMDDIENLERVRDAQAVDAGMRKLWLELLPAMDKTRRRVRFGQTRRAEDCMVTRLAKSPEWLYYGVPIADGPIDSPDTRSNWPGRYSMEWIRAERDRYRNAGMEGEFNQSYMLQVLDPATKAFKAEMLKELDVSPWHWMPRYAIYDPTRTTNEKRTRTHGKSDRAGKVVVSRLGSQILVHESAGLFPKPDEFIKDLFDCDERHHPVKIGIEKNSLDDWLLQPIRMEMMRRGVSLPMHALQAPQDKSKEDFILGLQPFARAGDVVLIGGKGAHAQLVAEWSNFPSGPRDIMNALAYALKMFAGKLIYADFSGANIMQAPLPKRGEDVFVGFQATAAEAVFVSVVRDGRRLCVDAAATAAGSVQDAVKTLAFALTTRYPKNPLQIWVPGDTYDQQLRVPLVQALRAAHLTPYRAENTGVARAGLSDRIRNTWEQKRMLTVDADCHLVLNALAAGYQQPIGRGGVVSQEPEAGTSMLVAQALECMVAMLDRTGLEATRAFPAGANIEHTPAGVAYVSANPRPRA